MRVDTVTVGEEKTSEFRTPKFNTRDLGWDKLKTFDARKATSF